MKFKTKFIIWFCLFSVTMAIKENTRFIHYGLTGYLSSNRNYFFHLLKTGLFQALMVFAVSLFCKDD